MLGQLLKKFGETYFSPKSFNNHLGVPISLSNLSSFDKYGVFEVGMSKAGEIKNLSKLIRPQATGCKQGRAYGPEASPAYQ